MGSSSIPKMPLLEVQDHMEEALNLCAVRDKVPFPQLISNKSKVKDAVNEVLSKLWYEERGMVIETIALTGLTLDAASRARVEQFDSEKLFADDPASLNALVALGLTEAMNSAASNPAGAVGGFAGIGMAHAVSGNTAVSTPVTSYSADPAANSSGFSGLENCPFCGTPLSSQIRVEYCPACNADIRSYYTR